MELSKYDEYLHNQVDLEVLLLKSTYWTNNSIAGILVEVRISSWFVFPITFIRRMNLMRIKQTNIL